MEKETPERPREGDWTIHPPLFEAIHHRPDSYIQIGAKGGSVTLESTLLCVSNVSKSFGGVSALKEVDFDVRRGECVALVGENGAGKSTLMKILSGVWPHGTYSGEIHFEGKPLNLKDPLEGRRSGISIIHQELCLFPKLTVAENLFLTEGFPYDGAPSLNMFERVHWDALYDRAGKLFLDLGFDVDPRARIEELSVAQCQLVEIARAFHHNAKLLILDEPTSALSQKEVGHLFEVIRRMRKASMAFIYISHKLDEVFTLADRIVVLRDGRAVQELVPKTTDEAEVIRHMVGRPVQPSTRKPVRSTAEPILIVKNLSHSGGEGRRVLEGISFELAPGEVLGIAGLMGSGRSELLRSLLGILPGNRGGSVQYYGREVDWTDIKQAMNDGVAFVPEDRKKDGLFLDHPISFNLTISVLQSLVDRSGCLDVRKEKNKSKDLVAKMGVKCASTRLPVKALSGGNQQKVLLGKVVALKPNVLMLDEPTRGIDVGAKEEIYAIIRQLASENMSILLVSSELPEILSLSDRVLVLREGKAVGELFNDGLTQEQVMSFAAGNAHGENHGLYGNA